MAMISSARACWLLLMFLAAVAPVRAQGTTAAGDAGGGQQGGDDAPAPAPLAVGAPAFASVANLVVEAFGVTVAADRVGYTYALRNTGPSPLALAASVAMPVLETGSDAVYDLPAPMADNPVDLAVKSDGKPVATSPFVAALALGIDRAAELKAAHIPLVPFGADAEKAIASATPETLARLAGLGLVSPSDPAQPDAPAAADWSLHVTHGWTQSIGAGKTATVAVDFAPIKAVYRIDKGALASFDPLKDQICLTPRIAAALKAALKAKDARMDVVDIEVANDKPTRWIASPAMTIAVRKPKPSSVVAFCGADAAGAAQPVVKGVSTDNAGAAGLRVMIFTPAAP